MDGAGRNASSAVRSVGIQRLRFDRNDHQGVLVRGLESTSAGD